MKKMTAKWATWLLVLFLSTMPTFAGNEGYWTTYNHHVEKGEWELMLMNDFTFPSKPNRDEGQRNYLSHMLEIEYGITEQWAVEVMIESFEDIGTGHAKYTGQRFETRYRLFRDEVPLNPMIYFEYEDLHAETRYKMEVSGWVKPPYEEAEGETKREKILESRLILSQDVGKWNFAFNWINESDLRNGKDDFGYSIGAMYHFGSHHGAVGIHHDGEGDPGCICKASMPNCKCAHCKGENIPCPCHKSGHGGIMAGVELFGGVGDSKSMKIDLPNQQHYLQPIIMISLTENMALHLGFAKGLSDSSDDMIRFAFVYEF